jgi:hypothetical protein
MGKLEQLLSTVEPELLDRLVPLASLGTAVVTKLLGIPVSRSTVYKWPDNGLETISTNGDGTGQKFTTRRWLLEFWIGEESGGDGTPKTPRTRRERKPTKSAGGAR